LDTLFNTINNTFLQFGCISEYLVSRVNNAGINFSLFAKTIDMKDTSNPRQTSNNDGDTTSNKAKNNLDIKDSARDNDRLRREEATLDLPEVRDIPGQEHVHVPALGELADTTISSDDEEGTGILDDLNDEDDTDIRMGTEADLTTADRAILETGDNYLPTDDENRLQQASLDNTDFEGEPLNENSFGQERTGADLDVPGGDADDADEKIGEEDEENNSYSLGSDSNDQVVEGTP
jgi:hypothetical protein